MRVHVSVMIIRWLRRGVKMRFRVRVMMMLLLLRNLLLLLLINLLLLLRKLRLVMRCWRLRCSEHAVSVLKLPR